MSVVVARPSIAKQWQDNTGSMIGVRSTAPVETLLEIVSAAVKRGNATLPQGYMFVDPWPTPQGVAFYVEDADTKDSILTLVEDIAASLDEAGVDARIGPLTNEPHPWPNRLHNDGFSAAMTIVGEPYWDAPGDPGGRRFTQRMWDADLGARAQVIEHAVAWCEVDNGGLWLTADVSTFKIPREQAIALMMRIVETGTICSIVAARDAGLVRRVEFNHNGFAIFELGGTDRPDWQTCVEDLTSVLTDLHSLIEWGFVQSRPTSVSGIGPRTMRVVHNALWEPHKDEVPLLGYRQDPRRHTEFVLDVYGVQVLGPWHDVTALAGDWEVRDLDHGRKLVSSREPAAWFAEAPSLETLLTARGNFSSLVDPIWNPLEE